MKFVMRELAVLTGELADSLKDDETGLIIKKEDRKAQKVAVIYLVGEDPAKTEDTTEAPKTTAPATTEPTAEIKPEEAPLTA